MSPTFSEGHFSDISLIHCHIFDNSNQDFACRSLCVKSASEIFIICDSTWPMSTISRCSSSRFLAAVALGRMLNLAISSSSQKCTLLFRYSQDTLACAGDLVCARIIFFNRRPVTYNTHAKTIIRSWGGRGVIFVQSSEKTKCYLLEKITICPFG